MDEQQNREEANSLNSTIIAGVAFAMGAVMSIYFTIREDLGMGALIGMLVVATIISLAAWKLVNFINTAGKADQG